MESPTETLAEWTERWLPVLPSYVHEVTAEGYARSFRLHVLPLLGDRLLSTLRRGVIREALETLVDRGHSKGVVRNCWIALSACLQAAVDKELLDTNPAHGATRKLFRRNPRGYARGRAMTLEQQARFFAAVPRVAPDLVLVYEMIADSGLRLGEVLALEPGHVHPDRAELWVGQTRRRGKGGRRDVRGVKGERERWMEITPTLAAKLRAHAASLPEGERWLFPGRDPGKSWSHCYVERTMTEVLRIARLPLRFTPHSFRHTRATMVLEETGDVLYVSRQLGHGSIQTTCDLYGSGAEPRRPEALERIEARRRAALGITPPTSEAMPTGGRLRLASSQREARSRRSWQ